MSGALRFTVVVPTYNRGAALERCLRALAAQTFSRDAYEVIVVDDGSRHPPRDLVRDLSSAMRVSLIEQENGGPASARNAGARAARGVLIAFTDDDCEPDPRWLSALNEASLRWPGHALGGPVVNAVTDSLTSCASALLIDYLYRYFNPAGASAGFFITSSVAYPTLAFRAMGGFDTSFPLAAAEDRDLCDRWIESGERMTHVEGAVVRHHHALRTYSFLRQHHNYGRGAFHLQQARLRRGEPNLRIEPVRFYAGMLRHPFAEAPPARALMLAALLAVSQLTYVAGYVAERRRRGAARRPTPGERSPAVVP